MINIGGKKLVCNFLWCKRLDKTLWMDYLDLEPQLISFKALVSFSRCKFQCYYNFPFSYDHFKL